MKIWIVYIKKWSLIGIHNKKNAYVFTIGQDEDIVPDSLYHKDPLGEWKSEVDPSYVIHEFTVNEFNIEEVKRVFPEAFL